MRIFDSSDLWPGRKQRKTQLHGASSTPKRKLRKHLDRLGVNGSGGLGHLKERVAA
jgi:hypothetical protein